MQPSRLRLGIIGLLAALALCAAGAPCLYAAEDPPQRPVVLPRPDHIVIVIEENQAYQNIIGSSAAPYINALARRGALFSQSYALAHPSQPNYLALFSGSTQNVADDSCPHTFAGDNLASALIRSRLSFAIYSESMPAAGYGGCAYGKYQRKHNPVANWQGINLPPGANRPFRDFPADYALLPRVALVVPDQDNDMHDGWGPYAVRRGDAWLEANLAAYLRWAETHNSLLILTWDEDDGSDGNRIPTIFVGPMVRAGVYSQRIDHYRVLRTILDMYSLAPIGRSAEESPIGDIWMGTTR